MDANNEVVAYLQALIDHYQDCNLENCPECMIVRSACEHVRNRIFGLGTPAVSPPAEIDNLQPYSVTSPTL